MQLTPGALLAASLWQRGIVCPNTALTPQTNCQVVAETLKVLLVAVTAAAQLSPSDGGDSGAASLMRVLLPLLIQVL